MRAVRGEDLVHDLELDVRLLGEVPVPAGMLGRAALRGDDHVGVARVLVDQRRGARLAGRAARRREQQDLRAVAPDVADLAAGLAVARDVRVAEEVLRLAHTP